MGQHASEGNGDRRTEPTPVGSMAGAIHFSCGDGIQFGRRRTARRAGPAQAQNLSCSRSLGNFLEGKPYSSVSVNRVDIQTLAASRLGQRCMVVEKLAALHKDCPVTVVMESSGTYCARFC